MNPTTNTLCFDGTFEGFLTVVHTACRENMTQVNLCADSNHNSFLFREILHIPTDRQAALKVWDALSLRGNSTLRIIYFSFLSENKDLLPLLYELSTILFRAGTTESVVRKAELKSELAPWAQKVEREKRRLESQMRFPNRVGKFNCCRLRPVYDVLPLLTRFCRGRFGTDPWMLIDTRRKYGLCQEGGAVQHFRLDGHWAGTAGYRAFPKKSEGLPPGKSPSLQMAV